MANVLVEEGSLSNIASAIREKNGGSATYKPSEMATAISNLPTGGSNSSSDSVEFKICEGLVRRCIQEDSDESSGIPEIYVNDTWETIGDYAFKGMNFRKTQFSYRPHTYEMLHTTFSNVTSIGTAAFSNISVFGDGYYRPTQEDPPKYVTWEFPKVTIVWPRAFYNTQGINVLNFPILTSVSNDMFTKTDGLLSLNIPNLQSCDTGMISYSDVKTLSFPLLSNVRGSGYLCSYSNNLTTLELGITNNSYYGLVNYARNLIKVVLPQMASINSKMFNSCSNIKTIVLSNPSNVCTLSNASYLPTQITNTANTTSYVYVPQALLANYKTATNWAAFSSKIRAIEDYPDITGG